MALNRLRTEDMIRVTREWVTEGRPAHVALSQEPILAALLPEVEEAHAELCACHREQLATERILEIIHTQKRVDERHDSVIRSIWHALMAESHFARDPKRSAEMRRLLSQLLPDGLESTQKSYREQARAAERMAERLSSGDRALLAQVSVGGDQSLLDAVDEWIALAAHLGSLERERTQDDDPLRARKELTLTSRNQWARTVRMVRTVASVVATRNPEIGVLVAELDAFEKRGSDESATAADGAPFSELPQRGVAGRVRARA